MIPQLEMELDIEYIPQQSEEFYELEGDEDLMYEMGSIETIVINENNTITVYEALDYNDNMEIIALDTCFATWSLNGDELTISETVTCTSDDGETEGGYCSCWSAIGAEGEALCESGELSDEISCLSAGPCLWDCMNDYEDDYEDEMDNEGADDEMPTISMNSDGHLTFGLSTTSYCEFLGSSDLNMYEEENDEPSTEDDCKTALEEMLFFDTGSNNGQNQTDLIKKQKIIVDWLQSLYPQINAMKTR